MRTDTVNCISEPDPRYEGMKREYMVCGGSTWRLVWIVPLAQISKIASIPRSKLMLFRFGMSIIDAGKAERRPRGISYPLTGHWARYTSPGIRTPKSDVKGVSGNGVEV